jgi:hypothetical protein
MKTATCFQCWSLPCTPAGRTDRASDFDSGHAVQRQLFFPLGIIIVVVHTASKSSRSSPTIPRRGAISCCWIASTTVVSSETFTLDPKTLRRAGRALQSSPGKRVRLLRGQAAARKGTPKVVAFVRMPWMDLIAHRSYGPVGRLLREINTVFGFTLSLSGVRPLIQALKHPASAAALNLALTLTSSLGLIPFEPGQPLAYFFEL